MCYSDVAVYGGSGASLVHPRRGECQVILIAHGDCPGLTGQVGGPASVGETGSPGIVGGLPAQSPPNSM